MPAWTGILPPVMSLARRVDPCLALSTVVDPVESFTAG